MTRLGFMVFFIIIIIINILISAQGVHPSWQSGTSASEGSVIARQSSVAWPRASSVASSLLRHCLLLLPLPRNPDRPRPTCESMTENTPPSSSSSSNSPSGPIKEACLAPTEASGEDCGKKVRRHFFQQRIDFGGYM